MEYTSALFNCIDGSYDDLPPKSPHTIVTSTIPTLSIPNHITFHAPPPPLVVILGKSHSKAESLDFTDVTVEPAEAMGTAIGSLLCASSQFSSYNGG